MIDCKVSPVSGSYLLSATMGLKENDNDSPSSVDKDSSSEKKSLIRVVALVNSFLFSSCFFMGKSVFPYMAKRLGADVVTLGYLNTLFSFVLLCGGPLYGRFGDVFGSRAMVITDTSDKAGRAAALGKLGLAFSLGIMAGPLLGGFVTEKFGDNTTALLASLLSLVSVITVQMFLPKHTKSLNKQEAADSKSQDKSILTKTLDLLNIPQVLYMLVAQTASFMPIMLLQALGPVINMEYFKIRPKENGLFLAGIGAASAFLLQYFAKHTFLYVVSQLILIIGFSITRTMTTSMATKSVSRNDTGLLLGLCATSEALMRTVAPAIGTFMLLHYGWPSLGALGSAIEFGIASILLAKKQI
ncbi:solute carrier family 22 member 18-like [Stylophora pistillata]|uniref:solute carrier family 22 member 18-like n=1 Tax=Stylophora pistillata TaxID=50429 RepID=UPI000C054147|nr:solute carrier family 22 member 18-like [Stylophora pistillata]